MLLVSLIQGEGTVLSVPLEFCAHDVVQPLISVHASWPTARLMVSSVRIFQFKRLRSGPRFLGVINIAVQHLVRLPGTRARQQCRDSRFVASPIPVQSRQISEGFMLSEDCVMDTVPISIYKTLQLYYFSQSILVSVNRMGAQMYQFEVMLSLTSAQNHFPPKPLIFFSFLDAISSAGSHNASD